MKKVILPGLLAGLVMAVISVLVGLLLDVLMPSLKGEYQNPNLFRAWSDPLMQLMYVQPFILGIILAWLWDRAKSLFLANSACAKGFQFGVIYWVLTIPGMFISYTSFPISLSMTLSWTISIFVQAIFAGWVLAKLNK